MLCNVIKFSDNLRLLLILNYIIKKRIQYYEVDITPQGTYSEQANKIRSNRERDITNCSAKCDGTNWREEILILSVAYCKCRTKPCINSHEYIRSSEKAYLRILQTE